MRKIETETQIITLEYWGDLRRITIKNKKKKNSKLNSKSEWLQISTYNDINIKCLIFNKIIDLTTTIMGQITFDYNNIIKQGFIEFCTHKNSSKNLKQINGIFRLEFSNNLYTLKFITRNGDKSSPLAKGEINELLTFEIIDDICNKISDAIIYYATNSSRKKANIIGFKLKDTIKQEQLALKELQDYATINNDYYLLEQINLYNANNDLDNYKLKRKYF